MAISKKDRTIKNITFTALFAALTCIATSIIRIPIPATGGYIHPGDAFVILSGIFLGPIPGLIAGGAGSALSDLIGGYVIYVPITFITKALIAVVAYYVYLLAKKAFKKTVVSIILAGMASTVILVLGYFIFEYLLYGKGAILSLFSNLIQGISGIIISILLSPIFVKVKKSFIDA